jgi:hypothetical protein
MYFEGEDRRNEPKDQINITFSSVFGLKELS